MCYSLVWLTAIERHDCVRKTTCIRPMINSRANKFAVEYERNPRDLLAVECTENVMRSWSGCFRHSRAHRHQHLHSHSIALCQWAMSSWRSIHNLIIEICCVIFRTSSIVVIQGRRRKIKSHRTHTEKKGKNVCINLKYQIRRFDEQCSSIAILWLQWALYRFGFCINVFPKFKL